jgi:3-phosphoshikimate 1-carboxyvinyltransferase
MSAPVLDAPPSKSLTHRALLLGALSSVPCVVRNPGLGADNQATLDALRAWGARATVDEAAGEVRFEPFQPGPAEAPLDCGNSGTTLRLLTGQASRFPFPTTLTGDASLRTRPNGPLLSVLQELGAQVGSGGGCAPLDVRGPIEAADVSLRGGLSSQFASSVLLALAQVPGPSRVRLLPPVASRPYLDLTFGVSEAFGLGLEVHESEGGLDIKVPGGRRPAASSFVVEGDWSGAAFPLVAAALLGREVEVRGIRSDSAQGDRAILELLRKTGATIDETAIGVRLTGRAQQSLGSVDVGATPDLFPILASLAAAVPGISRLHGSPGLRHKECDRIAAMAEGLRRMGIQVDELADGAVIHGDRGALQGATVRAFDDHRIHMALAVLAEVAEGPSDVSDPDCVAVSYPSFHADLARLAAS